MCFLIDFAAKTFKVKSTEMAPSESYESTWMVEALNRLRWQKNSQEKSGFRAAESTREAIWKVKARPA